MELEEIGRYDPYTDSFLMNTTADRIEVGTDGNLYRLSVSNGSEYSSKGRLYIKGVINQAKIEVLTELQAEIEETVKEEELIDKKWANGLHYSEKIIQEKINALKGEGKEINKMIVYTCPKCGKDLQFRTIATYPPIHVTECSSCGWREEKMDKIERIPYKITTAASDVALQPSSILCKENEDGNVTKEEKNWECSVKERNQQITML